MNEEVTQFFTSFEQANTESDVARIGGLYADTFMFGGPNGVQAVKKEDFLKVVPKMQAHYASMGLVNTGLHSIATNTLDSKYLLVAVTWRINLQIKLSQKHVDALATYILQRRTDDSLVIVFQIDHQDLASVVKGMQAPAQ